MATSKCTSSPVPWQRQNVQAAQCHGNVKMYKQPSAMATSKCTNSPVPWQRQNVQTAQCHGNVKTYWNNHKDHWVLSIVHCYLENCGVFDLSATYTEAIYNSSFQCGFRFNCRNLFGLARCNWYNIGGSNIKETGSGDWHRPIHPVKYIPKVCIPNRDYTQWTSCQR